jgi:hypothetical protein
MNDRLRLIFSNVILTGILIITFGYHYQYTNEPVKMSELQRIHAVVPYTETRDVTRVLHSAVQNGFCYLNQLMIYVVLDANGVDTVTDIRLWEGLFAVLAVFWVFRLGCLCCHRLLGLAGALVLALAPPQLVGSHALHMVIILIHAELLFYAVRSDSLFIWTAWSTATALLFMAGIFAEPLLLQSWFLALIIIWCVWYWICTHLPEYLYHDEPHLRRVKHHKDFWQQLQTDPGLLRYSSACIVIISLTLITGTVGGIKFELYTSSFENIIVALFISLLIGILFCIVIVISPIFSRERIKIIDALMRLRTVEFFGNPEDTFVRIRLRSLFNMMCAYAVGILIFIPLFYIFYRDVSLYVRTWECGKFFSFMATQGIGTWILFLLPLVAFGLTLTGYFLHVFSRTRIIGVVVLLVCSCIYIFQQRYAVFSAPFFALASVLALILPFEILFSFIRSAPCNDDISIE